MHTQLSSYATISRHTFLTESLRRSVRQKSPFIPRCPRQRSLFSNGEALSRHSRTPFATRRPRQGHRQGAKDKQGPPVALAQLRRIWTARQTDGGWTRLELHRIAEGRSYTCVGYVYLATDKAVRVVRQVTIVSCCVGHRGNELQHEPQRGYHWLQYIWDFSYSPLRHEITGEKHTAEQSLLCLVSALQFP